MLAAYGDVWPAQLALHRTDIDDAPTTPRNHATRHGLTDEECAVQIGAHQLVPVRFSEFGQWPATLNTRIVDQNFQRSDTRFDVLDCCIDGSAVRHVEGLGVDVMTLCCQRRSRRLQCIDIAPIEHDSGASLGQPACDRQANTSA